MKAIENVTMINGSDSRKVSDETIHGLINVLEADIATLEATKNKTKSLKASIKAKQDDIDALVKFCDERTQ